MDFGDYVDYYLDRIPIVGHGKAMVHYATGDKKRGDKVMRDCNRSTMVTAGATFGAIGGPGTAAACAIAGGMLADSIHSYVDDEGYGYVKYTAEICDDVSNGECPTRAMVDVTELALRDGYCGRNVYYERRDREIRRRHREGW